MVCFYMVDAPIPRGDMPKRMGAKFYSNPLPALKGEAFGLLLGNVFSIMISGQAYLGVLAGNSMFYAYRCVPSNSGISSNPSDA